MKLQAGMWVDHRSAVVVKWIDGQESVCVLHSPVEKHIRPAGGSCSRVPYGPQDVMKEDTRQRRFEQHLDRWYGTLIESLGDVDAMIVFGPGPAKREFAKRVEATRLGTALRAVETCEKMTIPQIRAKVRTHFRKEEPVGV